MVSNINFKLASPTSALLRRLKLSWFDFNPPSTASPSPTGTASKSVSNYSLPQAQPPSDQMPLVSTCELSGIKLNGLPPPRSCELCRKRKDGIQRCASCQSVWCCSKDCQAEDWPDHKVPRAFKEEKKLREHPGDFMTPPNLFGEHTSRFWGIFETRDYMRARYSMVDTMLMSYGTAGGLVDLIETCLHHLLDKIVQRG
ncbi:hypothetical protein CCMA1212_008482 [Trichoderma ghanense]|uniref:MYND-type domain-containing protein n=1 Tax=Trichoderma ghanense TaxID=65468 RepID=A0ABY2GWH5_9HYPO